MCMWCVIQYKWTYARTHVLCPQSHNMAAIYTMVHYDCKTSKIIIGFTNGWYVSSLGQTSCGTKSTYAVVWPRFTVCVKPISGTIASAFVQYNMWCISVILFNMKSRISAWNSLTPLSTRALSSISENHLKTFISRIAFLLFLIIFGCMIVAFLRHLIIFFAFLFVDQVSVLTHQYVVSSWIWFS